MGILQVIQGKYTSPTSITDCQAVYRYASSDASILQAFNEADAFGKLMRAAVDVAKQHAEMPAADVRCNVHRTGSLYGHRVSKQA